MTRVFLVRHGTTLWNQGGRYQGHTDVALGPEGIEQAEKLGRRMASEPIAAVYSSDLSRALDTARAVAHAHGLEVKVCEELREVNFGVWEGLSFRDIQRDYADLAARWFNEPSRVAIPQGESFEDVKERSYKFIKGLAEKHPDQTVVAVSHGGTIRTVICAILDLELDRIWRLRQDNTAVNTVDFYEEDRVTLTLFNDTCHLFSQS